MECGFQGPWPIMAQVAQGKLSRFLTLSERLACLLGCEASMASKAFPTLKLNGGFLFFLKGSQVLHRQVWNHLFYYKAGK